ncbi:nitrate regulatory protein [Pseudorhodoferax sp. Leaf267]|uniref:nitrate regulatory protein n=1 Tax=Pseudorhodoferax sp. Leaf267 TaxID=1736316 RepID=UPI0006F98BAE|nr:nitrate regulatory protein [Pseudorhodoferax sp. Leaf267]KQP22038.1 antitermination regulator [Pseudorhodoferax sp. Leaf267]
MKTGLTFLIAARECEIGELEQLALTSALVGAIGRLVHALQRERGMSNVFLASGGTRFAEQRTAQIGTCDAIAREVRGQFDALDTQAGQVRNGARLFNRIAVVLHGLDALPDLRARIAAQALGQDESTAAFVRLLAGLLAVVFEAADSATDPDISRALVAMFNFMQGKEFSGQERAFGGGCFASGHADGAHQQQWLHLIESQERCFQVAMNFSDASVREAWQAAEKASPLADLERLRRIGCAPRADGHLDPDLSQGWYDACTLRIDLMREVEELLATRLRTLCETRIASARAELRDQQAILATLSHEAQAGASERTAGYGPQLDRSILTMVQEQSQRLQEMNDELETVRASLNERKLIERAKGLLMAARKVDEAEAHKMLRQTAMNQNRRLLDVAQSVLAMSDYL